MSPDGPVKQPPEEKLLRLIRGKSNKPVHSAGKSADKNNVSATLHAKKPIFITVKGLPVSQILIWALGVLLFCELVGLTVYVMRPWPNLEVSAIDRKIPEHTLDAEGFSVSFPSLAASAGRQVFKASIAPPVSKEKRHSPSEEVKQLAARLTLLGIVSGDPAQAILEDSKTKKTYFATAGQVILEGALLESILDNRVILDLNGEQIELTL